MGRLLIIGTIFALTILLGCGDNPPEDIFGKSRNDPDRSFLEILAFKKDDYVLNVQLRMTNTSENAFPFMRNGLTVKSANDLQHPVDDFETDTRRKACKRKKILEPGEQFICQASFRLNGSKPLYLLFKGEQSLQNGGSQNVSGHTSFPN